jgi:hypothetical protein
MHLQVYLSIYYLSTNSSTNTAFQPLSTGPLLVKSLQDAYGEAAGTFSAIYSNLKSDSNNKLSICYCSELWECIARYLSLSLSMYLSMYLFMHLSIYVAVYLFIYIFTLSI